MKCYCCNKEDESNVLNFKENGHTYHDGHIYHVCNDCIETLGLPFCEKCNLFFRINRYVGFLNAQNIDSHFFCNDCIEKVETKKCKHCGKNILSEDNSNFCVNCANNFIHTYSYKPSPVFHGNSSDNLFCGIELEINFDDTKAYKMFIEKYKDNDFVYLKHDGSIGRFGVEIVSHPATFGYHLKNNWKNIFEMLNKTNTLGCGLHFHISKNAFNENQIKFLDYFVNNFPYEISQIGSRELKHYCQIYPNRRSYGYRRCSHHTDACNLSNSNTVELRFCKSTNNYHSFIKKIKNVFALIAFTRYVSSNYSEYLDKADIIKKGFKIFREELLSRI